jgi:protein-S-isoprenylcysteine O-methyltransferase Ste14
MGCISGLLDFRCAQDSRHPRKRILRLPIFRFGVRDRWICPGIYRCDQNNVLKGHFLPRSLELAIVGVVLTWVGIGLAVWARYHLAEYWSARITIKEDHQLIRTGPYARLRHPIYTGLITATVGSAVVIDRWRCVLGVCLVVLGYCLKAGREEAMLSQKFGEAFREHKKHTGFLIPRLR